MALPSNNLNLSIIKNALRESSNKLTELATSSKINKWSKYKPVKNSFTNTLSEIDFKSSNYGLNIPSLTTVNTTTLLTEWSKIALGTTDPKRIGDFREYDHGEMAPLNIPLNKLNHLWNSSENENPTIDIPLTYKTNNENQGGVLLNRLNVEDLINTNNNSLKDLYFSIIVFDEGSTHVLTNPNKLSSKNISIQTNLLTNTSLRNYLKNTNKNFVHIYPFLNTVNTYTTTNGLKNYNIGRITPMPTSTTIGYTIARESIWWLKFGILDYFWVDSPSGNWELFMHSGDISEVSKTSVINTNNSSLLTIEILTQIKDNPEGSITKSILDISKIYFNSEISGVYNNIRLKSLTIDSLVNPLTNTYTIISTTLTQTGQKTYDCSAIKGTNNYYEVFLTIETTAQYIRNNAINFPNSIHSISVVIGYDDGQIDILPDGQWGTLAYRFN